MAFALAVEFRDPFVISLGTWTAEPRQGSSGTCQGLLRK